MTAPISMNLAKRMEPDSAPPSALDNNTVYEWILQTTFTTSARAQMAQQMAPYLSALVRRDDRILDLCCGSGPMSFWFEEQGAEVTGVDCAPYMIALARVEAFHRNSSVKFVEADIFTHDLGWERFDLVSCFGNSISDFPLSNFAKLVKRVAHALKPQGRFLLEYHDGSYEYMQGHGAREGVYQETPERISFRFETYLPEIGARVMTIENETRGVAYQRKGYIYTVPSVHLAASQALALERHVNLAESHYLDSFVKAT